MKGDTRPIAGAIVLTFVTCGIYFLFWIYWVGRDVRDALERNDVMPGLDLALCVFCFPIYAIWWTYRTSRLVREVQRKAGVDAPADVTVLATVLSCFGLFVVSVAMLQDGLNEAWARTP